MLSTARSSKRRGVAAGAAEELPRDDRFIAMLDPKAELSIESLQNGRGRICREILEELPEWFGIPEAIDAYAAFADEADTLACIRNGTVGGIAVLRNTSKIACEIYLLAVLPALHRRGLGRRLVDATARLARARGRRYLTVKTLGPSRPNEAYDATRKFYEAVGFEALEELEGIWHGNPTLLMLKPI